MSGDHRARAVLARMRAELQRQAIAGGIVRTVPFPDSQGRVEIIGVVDLAALADVTESALVEMFGHELDAYQS